MNIWDRRAAQAENEQNGIKIRVEGYPGIVFTVRPLCDWNDDYLRAQIAAATRPDMADLLRRMKSPDYEMTPEDKALDKAISVETFVRGCIITWEGIPHPTGVEGETWPFTPENGVKFFQHFPDVYTVIRREAMRVENFRKPTEDEARAKVAGNSKRVLRSKSEAGAS
jgi:hypothetical protein